MATGKITKSTAAKEDSLVLLRFPFPPWLIYSQTFQYVDHSRTFFFPFIFDFFADEQLIGKFSYELRDAGKYIK